LSRQRFNVLIVDPDSSSRGNLKQAAMALTTFNKVYIAGSLDEAFGKTGGGESIDVLTLSYRFELSAICKFVERAKQTPRGEGWAYIAVLKASDQNNKAIADGVVGGINGFLLEPYSADNLRQVAEVTGKIKAQNEMKRVKAAIAMLLKEIVKHLDAVAMYKAKGKNPVAAYRRLRESCKSLQQFNGPMYDAYVEACAEILGNLPPPALANYSGVSERVKKRMEAKALEELEKQYS
jgi:CheY-like chemotaxis protein